MSSSSDGDGNVPNRGPVVFAVTTATLVLASVFVFARIICRFFIVRKVSWDDYAMILAWLIAFFLSFTIDFGVAYGLGKRDADIHEDDWPILRRCEYVFSILYNPALMAVKTSILIFFLRLAKNTQNVLRWASWATLIVVNVAGVVLTFMNIFQCRPIDAAWNYHANESHHVKCIPLLTEFICSSPVNIVTDLAILAMPIPVLTGMRLPSRQKTILVVTFALGIFVTIVDVVRIYYLQRAISRVPTSSSTNPDSRFGGQEDFSYNGALSLMWSAVEVNVGMTCACIPTLKPLILKLLPAMLYDPDGSGPSVSKQGADLGSRTPSGLTQPPPAAAPPPAIGQGSNEANASESATGMDFVTTPWTNSGSGTAAGDSSSEPPRNSDGTPRARTNMTASTAANENAVYFGFVNMAKPKSMLKTSGPESWKYCTIVSVLFLLWGLSYGLLNTLNNVVAIVNHMTTAQTLGLTSAYFGGGYFFGPLLVGEWILRRDEHKRTRRQSRNNAENVGGFKVTFIVGLCIYGVGTIIFWPSAVTASWGGFMLSNFVVGFGLSVLEVGANAFMVLCGPPAHGETRLMLAQGVQGVGSVLSGVLAQKVFFVGIGGDGGMNDSMTLINVQWTYLGITLLSVILALFFYYMPLPEVSDAELEESANKLPIGYKKKSIGGLQLRTVTLILAVAAQYAYVASQECNSIYFANLLISVTPEFPSGGRAAVNNSQPNRPNGYAISISDYALVGHTFFALTRFILAYFTHRAAYSSRWPRPCTILMGCNVICFTLALLMVVLHLRDPNLLVIPVLLFFAAEGPIWPLIFAIGLRGQGRRTKRAAAFITMGASGPAFFPFVMYAIITSGGTVQTAFIVIVALQAVVGFFPLYLALARDARVLLDPRAGSQLSPNDEGTTRAADGLLMDASRRGPAEKEKRRSLFSRKLPGWRRRSSATPEVQHAEESSKGRPGS